MEIIYKVDFQIVLMSNYSDGEFVLIIWTMHEWYFLVVCGGICFEI